MDESAEQQASESEELKRVRTMLEHRTEQWRDVLRLVAATEARCAALEQTLLNHECVVEDPDPASSIEVSLAPRSIDWDQLRSAQVNWVNR